MKKRASLTAALADTPANEAASAAPASTKTPKASVAVDAKRAGEVNVAAWFPPAVKYGLQELALERSRVIGRKVTLRELMAEAFNDLFKKYGKAEVAPGAPE